MSQIKKNKNKVNLQIKENDKLADVIIEYAELLSLLPKFKINLGFGDATIAQVCNGGGIDQKFMLMIFNLYVSNYLPDNNELGSLNVDAVIEYLRQSHDYYRQERIPGIESGIKKMEKSCLEKHYNVLKRFFDEYKNEVINHFKYEENIVFPYIESLVRGEVALQNFNINKYEDNHGNIEDKLSDLKSILIKYLPMECAENERMDVLRETFMFEEDLKKHSLIEDKVLIPLVMEFEKLMI